MPRLLSLLLALVVLAGCATAPPPREIAARLDVAEALLAAGDPAGARAELAQTPRRHLLPADQLRHDLLSARFLLDDRRPTDALALLLQPEVPPAVRDSWLGLRAEALAATGDRFGTAAALAERSQLRDGEARARDLRDAERELKSVTDGALLQQAAFLDDQSPLLPLAQREARRRGLEWTPRVAPAVLADRPAAAADGYHPPRRVAVLLPFSGDFAAAGQAVRDGLLAAYYSETRARPPIGFYDTLGSPDGARQALVQALAEGADLVVGPLRRDEVAALSTQPFAARWVALNRKPVASPGGASFTLAPEDEGLAAADRLVERGLLTAVAIAEADDAAQRSLRAFRERFAAAGGRLLATAALDPTGGTAAQALATLAPLAGSAQALFLAARAPAARILLPQREGAGLGGLPVLATSLAQAGGDPRLDRELDGLQYPELPWLLGHPVGPGDADALGRTLPSARGSAARLFAFGYDAWTLAAYLDALRGGLERRGATGELGIDAAGIVERRPAWAEYSGGLSRPAGDGALVPMPLPATR